MKMIISAYFSLVLLVTSLSCSSQGRKTLEAEAFNDKVKSGTEQILDVRTVKEFESGYIKHAMLADWLKRQEFVERTTHLDKSKDLYVYCASGVRSADAAKYLRNQGFISVIELDGGLIDWKKKNLPLEKNSADTSISSEAFQAMINSKPKVLIDFGAEWCPPCKKMEPILNEFAKTSDVVVIKLDANNASELMNLLNVNSIPTLIYYKNGKEAERLSGFQSMDEIKRLTN